MTPRFFTAGFAAWQATAIVSLLALAGSARAQDKVLIVNGTTMNDVVTSFAVLKSNETAATANREILQSRLGSGAAVYPWYWPGPASTSQSIYIDDTLLTPKHTARRWSGLGLCAPGGTGGGSVLGSRLCLRATTYKVTFDGATKKLTSSGAGATVTVTGREVTSRDVFNSVLITDGMNVTPGWYGIVSVTPGASGSGVWTLDRAWCTDAVTDGEGSYCPAIVADRGFGASYEGMSFTHLKTTNPLDASGFVCFHALSQTGGAINTGNQHFTDCSFGYAQVGLLIGLDMAGAYHDVYSSVEAYPGWNAGQGQTVKIDHCLFGKCATAIYCRNQQAVHHEVSHVDCDVTDAAFRFDAGGKLTASSVHLTGSAAGSSQCLLKLGRKISVGSGPFIISGVSFDGGGNTRNPQLVVTDWAGQPQRATIAINGANISRNSAATDDLPLIDVQAACRIRLRDAEVFDSQGDRGIWPASIVLKQGEDSSYRPHVLIEGCALEVTSDPADIVKHAECDAGCTVEFIGNCTPEGAPLRNGRYVTGQGEYGAWDTTTSGWSAPE
jgi:hypothetical protein